MKDKEHGGAVNIVRKTLICSPKVTCTTSRNMSVAGVKKLPHGLRHGNKYQQILDFLVSGTISNTIIQYNTSSKSMDKNTIRIIHGDEN